MAAGSEHGTAIDSLELDGSGRSWNSDRGRGNHRRYPGTMQINRSRGRGGGGEVLASIPFESDARYESDENENNAEKKTLSRERDSVGKISQSDVSVDHSQLF